MDKALNIYYDSRAVGRDVDSKKFKTDWSQREGAVKEFLSFAGYSSCDELILFFQQSVDNKKHVDSLLFNYYSERCKTMKKSSAKQYVMKVAAMFTANYERVGTSRISKDAKETSDVRKVREHNQFFDYNDNAEILGFNSLAKEYFARLNFRDRTVLLASASSGQPPTVILGLTVGEVRSSMRAGKDRILLMDDRSKTGEAYLTFISMEATKFIYKYLTTERKDADDDEPLFMARAGEPLKNQHLNQAVRRVCDAMGLIKNGTNPYSPYAMRGVFRTACDGIPSIPEVIKKRMMGHSITIGEGYSTTGSALVLPHYMKVESIVTLAHTATEYEQQQQERISALENQLEEQEQRHVYEMQKLKEAVRALGDALNKRDE